MSERKGLVLDANILLRGVFGRQVREILETYEDQARFYTPEMAFLLLATRWKGRVHPGQIRSPLRGYREAYMAGDLDQQKGGHGKARHVLESNFIEQTGHIMITGFLLMNFARGLFTSIVSHC